MPSGSLWVLGERQKCLALFPVERGVEIALKGVFGFDTELEASKWMAETAAMSTQSASLIERVKPFLASKLQ